MGTLDIWKPRLLPVPSTLECADMRLLCFEDEADPIFVGTGRIDIKSFTSMTFIMSARATDAGDAFRRLNRAKDNPYDIRCQFRLFVRDFEGKEWACGYAGAHMVDATGGQWLLTGELTGISTTATGAFVSNEVGAELIISPELDVPMRDAMVSVTTIGDEEIQSTRSAGRHTLEVLGSKITFQYLPEGGALYVSATSSDSLHAPFLENWLTEPLRILTGQLVYPRLIARNSGAGEANVSLRQSPSRLKYAGLSSLLDPSISRQPAKFWELYSALLTFIARARDKNGNSYFDANPLTQFYVEIIQATQGTRWVLCLTLASAAEGIAKMVMRPEEEVADHDAAELRSLRKAIKSWKGDAVLRERALNSVAYFGQRKIPRFLKDLVERGVLPADEVEAWDDVRNQVMHGNLVSPWGGEDEDRRLTALARLVHSLTTHLLEREGLLTPSNAVGPLKPEPIPESSPPPQANEAST